MAQFYLTDDSWNTRNKENSCKYRFSGFIYIYSKGSISLAFQINMDNPIYKILTTLAIPFKMILSNIPLLQPCISRNILKLHIVEDVADLRLFFFFFRYAQKYAKFPILFAHSSSVHKGTSLAMDQRKSWSQKFEGALNWLVKTL